MEKIPVDQDLLRENQKQAWVPQEVVKIFL